VRIGCEGSDWQDAELFVNSMSIFIFLKISSNGPQTIFTFDPSNDAVWRKLTLFGVAASPNFAKGFKILKNPSNFAPKGDSPAK
jgi:hypothetical protein